MNNFDFPVFFEKFLSAVCFRDLFEFRIINYLRAIDGPVSFVRLSVFDHSKKLTLSNVFNNKILLHFLSLGDSGLNFTDF